MTRRSWKAEKQLCEVLSQPTMRVNIGSNVDYRESCSNDLVSFFPKYSGTLPLTYHTCTFRGCRKERDKVPKFGTYNVRVGRLLTRVRCCINKQCIATQSWVQRRRRRMPKATRKLLYTCLPRSLSLSLALPRYCMQLAVAAGSYRGGEGAQ